MHDLERRTTRPHGLLLASDARAEGWASSLHSAARRDEVIKVRPGVYLDAARWAVLPVAEQYSVRLRAVSLTFRHPVFARASAAHLHGLPLLRARLERVHLHQTTPAGSRRHGDVTVHAGGGDPDIVTRDGMQLTSVVRTVLDLARTLPHAEALAIADAAVRAPDATAGFASAGAPLCTKRELTDAAAAAIPSRGGWAAYLALCEADAQSGSVGESFARSLFLRLGAPLPELQAPIRDADGLIGLADFRWRDHDVIGEFDGRLKYGADNPARLPPDQVVYREKLREDRMRRRCRVFIRFGWREVNDPPRMARILLDAGLPLDRVPEHHIGTSARRRPE